MEEKIAVQDIVWNKINDLQHNKLSQSTSGLMAELRRGVNQPPGSLPGIWGITLGELQEKGLSNTGYPTADEWAIHLSLTLFALHQGNKDMQHGLVSVTGYSIGRSARLLVEANKGSESSIRRQMNSLITANDIEEIAIFLRSFIKRFSNEGIPLDYPQLAKDLKLLQDMEAKRNVILKWAQDYASKRKDQENE